MRLITKGVIDDDRVFPADVIRKSHQRQADTNSYYDGYAWGWQLGTFEGRRELFHTGGFVGTSALISFLPEHDVGIVVLQNESGLRANYVAQIVKHMAYGGGETCGAQRSRTQRLITYRPASGRGSCTRPSSIWMARTWSV